MRLDPAGVQLPNRSRHASRARYLLAAAAGLGLLAAAGCGSSASAGGTVSSTVTIAAVPGVDDAPIFLAQKDGLFAAEGLTHVVIRDYKTQALELSALQGAQADIAASDYGNIFSQQVQSHDLRILADGYDATQGVLEVLTMPGSPVQSPLDLAKPGVKVGMPGDDVLSGVPAGTPQSLDSAAATNVLSDYLAGAARSVQWRAMPQPQELAELENHQLQAILVSEPYIYEAESKGAVEVLDACSGSTAGLPLLGYVAMNAWVRDNPGAVADFQAALAKAQSEASVSGQVQALLPGAAHMTTEVASMITVGTYPTQTSAASLDAVVLLMTNTGIIPSKTGEAPPVAPMIVRFKS